MLRGVSLALLLLLTSSSVVGFDHFITRNGAELRDGSKRFRFISVNIPNYFIIEDRATAQSPAWHRVTEFEQRDAARTVAYLGGQVLRVYPFSVEGGRNVDGKLAHIYDHNGSIAYHEELFRDMDRGLAIAEEYHLRVIIPLVDEWQWFGGHAEWARLVNAPEFWDDARARSAFQEFLLWLLNRRNTVTGRLYKEDPTILAWELGNEIESASDGWLHEMAAFIRHHDANHLLIDGGHKQLSYAALADPNIDILTTHYTDDRFDRFAERAAELGKGYLYGEFSPVGDPYAVRDIITRTIKSAAVGSLAWSLRFHSERGGFYYHADFNGESDSLHYPGFATTKPRGEEEIFVELRAGAYAIQGRTVPAEPPPEAPILLPFSDPGAISWQGAAGASGYRVERRQGESGKWETVAKDIHDATPQQAPDRTLVSALPLFSDRPGPGRWYYRVIACNGAGDSIPSNRVGVDVGH